MACCSSHYSGIWPCLTRLGLCDPPLEDGEEDDDYSRIVQDAFGMSDVVLAWCTARMQSFHEVELNPIFYASMD